MNKTAEWIRILEVLLPNQIEVSPLYMTSVMLIQQYQRALSDLREEFGKDNVKCIYMGLSVNRCKLTKYVLLRNEFTERKLAELKSKNIIPQNFNFHGPPLQEKPILFTPPVSTEFPSRCHEIAHENSLKNLKNQDQLIIF